jgi:hypothetical protein
MYNRVRTAAGPCFSFPGTRELSLSAARKTIAFHIVCCVTPILSDANTGQPRTNTSSHERCERASRGATAGLFSFDFRGLTAPNILRKPPASECVYPNMHNEIWSNPETQIRRIRKKTSRTGKRRNAGTFPSPAKARLMRRAILQASMRYISGNNAGYGSISNWQERLAACSIFVTDRRFFLQSRNSS